MKALLGTGVLLVGVVFATPPAMAAGGSTIRACLNDIRALCAGVRPGQGRIGSCIQSQFAELSPSCRLELIKAAVSAKACLHDFKSLCSRVEPGDGRLEACASARLSEASDGCRKAVARSNFGRQ